MIGHLIKREFLGQTYPTICRGYGNTINKAHALKFAHETELVSLLQPPQCNKALNHDKPTTLEGLRAKRLAYFNTNLVSPTAKNEEDEKINASTLGTGKK